MSALTSNVKGNLNSLYKLKNEYDWLVTNEEMTTKKLDKVIKIKKQMLYNLSTILCVASQDVIFNSFNLSVNQVDTAIIELLNQYKDLVYELEKPHNRILSEAKRVMSFLYSMDIVSNSIHIKIQNEEKLLEIKNNYLSYYNANQKMLALNYILSLIPKYEEGLKALTLFILEHKRKDELSFEQKHDIFNILKSVVFDYQVDVIRNKIFSEVPLDKSYNNNTEDYLIYFEQLFLNLVSSCTFTLPTFITQVIDEMSKDSINGSYINSMVDYISEKYNYDLKNEIKKQENIKEINMDKMKASVAALIDFSGITDLNELISTIKSSNMLPEYLKDSKDYNQIYSIVSNTDFLLKKDVQVYTVLDELSQKLVKNFDFEEYIKGYKFNKSDYVKQVAHFRQYYNNLLEESKKQVLSEYQQRIEKVIESSKIKEYDIKKKVSDISKYKANITTLENALKYINLNYREFSKDNFRVYLNAIQKRYDVEHLYEEVEKKRLKNNYKLKTKNVIYKEQEYLKSFIEKDIIKNNLCNEIIENVVIDDRKLQQEIKTMISNDVESVDNILAEYVDKD